MKTKIIKNMAILSLVGVLVPINAYSLTISLSTEFSGGATPSGVPTIVITPTLGNPDSVDVVITPNFSVGSTEYIDEVMFNYGGANPLTAAFVSGQEATDGIFFGSNAFKADGAGKFDIQFDYAASNADPNRFTEADINSYYTLSVGAGLGLSPLDFNFLSTASAKGSFAGAAHVQAIGAQGLSGWVGGPADGPKPPDPDPDPSVPEPTAVWMLGLGLLGVFGFKRRQCKLAA